jgi:hypothetical protein
MEDFNNNPAEEAVVETPEVVETAVVEEAPVVETPVVEEAPAAPAQEEEKAEEPTAIAAPSYAGSDTVQAVGTVANGAIGATTAKREPRKAAVAKPAKDEKTVAVKSTKNVSWVGVGKVSKGINIVSQKEAEQWLTRDHVTLVTPEEVKSEFGA